MTALVWLIPVALGLGALGLAGFLWALRNGQFDDLEGAGWRALDDGEPLQAGQAVGRSDSTPPPQRSGETTTSR